MIALLALSGAFVAPLPSRAAARARMAADDAPAPSDRYTMADSTGLLRSFLTGEKTSTLAEGRLSRAKVPVDDSVDRPLAALAHHRAFAIALCARCQRDVRLVRRRRSRHPAD